MKKKLLKRVIVEIVTDRFKFLGLLALIGLIVWLIPADYRFNALITFLCGSGWYLAGQNSKG